MALILEKLPQLNTNNLLYTAITRAKHDIKIFVPDEFTLIWTLNNFPISDSFITINNVEKSSIKVVS